MAIFELLADFDIDSGCAGMISEDTQDAVSLPQINCRDKGTRRILISGSINSDATGIDMMVDLCHKSGDRSLQPTQRSNPI